MTQIIKVRPEDVKFESKQEYLTRLNQTETMVYNEISSILQKPWRYDEKERRFSFDAQFNYGKYFSTTTRQQSSMIAIDRLLRENGWETFVECNVASEFSEYGKELYIEVYNKNYACENKNKDDYKIFPAFFIVFFIGLFLSLVLFL